MMMKSNTPAGALVSQQSSPFQISSHITKFAIVDCIDLAMQISKDSSGKKEEEGDHCWYGSVSDSCVPPLDQVTTCSEDCSDDVSSVSSGSVGVDDHEIDLSSFHKSSSSAPRSIFKKYWGAQGEETAPKLHRPLPTEISARITKLLTEEESPNQNKNIYEESLREREDNAEPGIAPKRRSIFSNRYQSKSAPTLHTKTTKCFDLRQIQSSHALGEKVPSKSCLRPSRYSCSGPARRRTSECNSSAADNNSVRFSDRVQVTVFQSSLERYAEEGWSDFFAYR